MLLLLLFLASSVAAAPCAAPHALVRQGGYVSADPRDDCVYCLAAPHERLCIGNEHAARNGVRLREAGVGLVVSAIGEMAGGRHEGLAYAVFDLADVAEQPIRSTALEAHVAISAFLFRGGPEKGKVFVHCAAGISRSSTLLAAHLLLAHPELTVASALDLIRAARPVIQPNPGFLQVLYDIERSRAGSEPDGELDRQRAEIAA